MAACLAEGWGLDVSADDMRYATVGGGSYHWDVADVAGRRYFVTVDDLDHKGWLGRDRDSTFAGLGAAFDTALTLRRDGGLPFVVAPVPAAGAETVLRVDARHAVALFPFVDGSCGRFGEAGTPRERAELVRLLAELHRATPVALAAVRPRALDLPSRDLLEAALGELDRPWPGGPFSESARELLAGRGPELRGRLEAFDRLAAEVAPGDGDLVVTHGEPHPGNVMRSAGRALLVDWDTVGLAPPERDLWLVTSDPDELARYTDVTGRRVDPAALALYRLRWELDDLATFTARLRSPHGRTADTEWAWRSLSWTVGSAVGGGLERGRRQAIR